MKIGFDIRPLMDRNYSGVSEFTFNLLSAMLQIAPHEEFLLFYNSYNQVEDRFPHFPGTNSKIVGTHYPNKLFNYFLQKFLAYPKLDRVLNSDVFYAPHINFYSLSKGQPSVITVHDLSFLRYPEFFSQRKNFWHSQLAAPDLVKKFTKIVAISENTKQDLIDLLGVPEEKIVVIHSAISSDFRRLEENDPERLSVTQKYGLPKKFMLFLGTIEPRKNIEGLIEAYDMLLEKRPELNDFELVIAGGNGWKTDQVKSRWETSPNKDKIRFLGYIDRKDKTALYNTASLFVFPSFYEGFGFPPLEAMACGTPVITSNVSSLPEVVGGAAVMVNPYDTAALAEAIEAVLTDQALAQSLKERGLVQSRKFDWNVTAEKYLRIFKEIK